MKKIAMLGLAGFLLALIASYAWAGPEEDSVQSIITGVAKAVTDFPQSRDVRSVLRFYSNDFTGIDDGEWYNFKEMERSLSDLKKRINRGDPIGISDEVLNINVHVAGDFGWATYVDIFRLVSGGQVEKESQSKCTAILQKMGAVWVIKHEHCSTPQAETMV